MKQHMWVSLAAAACVGLLGCKGSTGANGLNGHDGAAGANGAKGDPGAAGAAGAAGATGAKGDPGTDANITPSISAVSPDVAYIGRSVDLIISGDGTHFDSTTTVAFANPAITVNTVTVGSITGLVAHITVAANATPGTVNVTVATGAESEQYLSSFRIESALKPGGGNASVSQGGLALVHLGMQDLTTPLDGSAAVPPVGGGTSGVSAQVNGVTDFGIDIQFQADVLAVTGPFDLTVTDGTGASAVSSTLAGGLTVAARAPTPLVPGTPGAGIIQTDLDTGLYSYTPPDASEHFLHLVPSSSDGHVFVSVLPAAGTWASTQATVVSTFGEAMNVVSTVYFIVQNNAFGGGTVPAHYSLALTSTAATATSEGAESVGANNDTSANATALATLPALAESVLGYSGVDPIDDLDFYKVTVTGATVGAPKTIHAITGGDAVTDTVVEIFDVDGTTSLGLSSDLDYQEELSVPVTADGTYFIKVSASPGGFFNPNHAGYELFVEVQ